MSQPVSEPNRARGGAVVLVGSAAVVLGAVSLEVLAGQAANSPVSRWAALVPLTWPQPARVAWWLGIAGAAAGYRWSLRQVGLPARAVADVITVAPFVAFAAGIALGASWSTWH
jgi:hypothetical protein